MPDIRSFFGGKPAGTPASQEKKTETSSKKGRGSRKVIEDSDEEEAPKAKKSTPVKKAKREPSPEGQDTTTADYFATSSKPKRSQSTKQTASKAAKDSSAKTTPVKANGTSRKTSGTPSKKTTGSARSSTRQKQTTSYAEEENYMDDELDNDDDVFKTDFKSKGKGLGDDYEEGSADDDDKPLAPKRVSTKGGKQAKINKDDDFDPDEDVDMQDVNAEDDFVVPDDDEEIVEDKPAPKKNAKAGTKRKAKDLDEDDTEETPKKKGKKAAPAKKTAAKGKKEEATDSKEIKDIMESIPQVRAPSPPPKEGEDGKKKFPFGGAHANSGPAPAAGSLEIPEGAENCLAGRSFVFTGLLQSLQRDDGVSLVKRYGGKVMTAPSSKTDFIVLGNDAGPMKLRKIKEFGLKTIDEHGLFELIRRLPANGGDSKLAAQNAEKQKKEEDKIKQMAAEMEKEDRRTGGAGGAGGGKASAQAAGKGKETAAEDRLWTVKYAPSQLGHICGNKGQVAKLQKWLHDFPLNKRRKFKMPGENGLGHHRAVLISGPPGIGKTTAAHLVAKLEGYDVVETNASDTRSKKLVETGLKGVLDTRSISGYFAAEGKDVEQSKRKLVLIMDEVDGMSAGDRGGVGALAAICKKSEIPLILIGNDVRQPKMKPLGFVTGDLAFRRPKTEEIRSRIASILHREKMAMPSNVINALIEGCGGDIRQIVNMVSTAKLDNTQMSFDEGKQMSKSWEKHVILKPWDITGKILGGGMFAASSKSTLNDKIELYFNDHEFSYLMLQENYIGTQPILANNTPNDKMKRLKRLELVSKAAESISDGDLVDRMIHGSQQQWSLMPAHAIFSFVRPASFISGSMAGNSTRFTSWLGKNSNQGKLTRMVKEIQGHMRLRTSGDRHEIRQQYLPVLWRELVQKLRDDGQEAIGDMIELMDSYFLTKEDFDSIMELGVGEMDMERVKIDSGAKSAFTRKYNQANHPVPFMKASSVVAPKKQTKERPDLEEAIEESDDGEEVDVKEENADDEDVDITKDKYIKAPKKKPATKATKAKGKTKKAEEEEDDDEEDEKPRKGKGKAAAKTTKGKGKAKK